MASIIEHAARKLATDAALGIYTDKHISDIIDAVKQCDEDPDKDKAKLRSSAKKQYEKEGALEIDENAVVSISEGGAYIQAWVWIPKIG